MIEGESRGGVILSGSDIWTGWIQDSANWYKTWTEDRGLGKISFPDDPEGDLGRRAEMVFQEGILLRQVENLVDMDDGTYYNDEAVDRLYFRPSGGVPDKDTRTSLRREMKERKKRFKDKQDAQPEMAILVCH